MKNRPLQQKYYGNDRRDDDICQFRPMSFSAKRLFSDSAEGFFGNSQVGRDLMEWKSLNDLRILLLKILIPFHSGKAYRVVQPLLGGDVIILAHVPKHSVDGGYC